MKRSWLESLPGGKTFPVPRVAGQPHWTGLFASPCPERTNSRRAKIAYVFGSGLLFLFLSQIVTGVFLAMYYVPSADHAHTTVEYITKEVTSGSFLRSIHAYGSSAIIIVLLLHITQTFLYGSYKGRRELVWLAGCVLLVLMLGMAFTGYLLPWDQKLTLQPRSEQTF
jgi:quinol-cytochrome oxidoreductase complex cytochrome b subunit